MQNIIINLVEAVEKFTIGNFLKDLLQALSIAVIIILNYFTIKQLTYENKEKRCKEEKESINKVLSEFYGPLVSLRSQSSELYSIFALNEKKLDRDAGNRFRTVNYLANGKQFNAGDEELLKRIIAISCCELKLIESHSWAIENPSMSELFARFSAHISLIDSLNKNRVNQSDSAKEIIKKSVFPLEIDGAIESEIMRLKHKLKSIEKSRLSIFMKYRHNRLESKMKRKRNDITKYYDENSTIYFRNVHDLKLNPLYNKVIDKTELKMGAKILDVGCGTGRDTQYFIRKGYRVTSNDASLEMVKLCNSYPFAYCEHKLVEEIDYTNEFNLIWANAMLVHSDSKQLIESIKCFARAAKYDSYIFFSVKKYIDKKSEERNGRMFYFYKEAEIKTLITESIKTLTLIDLFENLTEVKSSDDQWLNFIYKKKLTDD